jgi:siroheme decarboxylase
MNAHVDTNAPLSPLERRLIVETQAGLPLVPRPFAALAEKLGVEEAEVLARFQDLSDRGAIRRIAAVPNHYRMGYVANGMSVWVVVAADMDAAGSALAALDWVTHCYSRPARLPDWPYTLFAMVHGKTRADVLARVKAMAEILGDKAAAHDVLFSTRILKKTGLRLKG